MTMAGTSSTESAPSTRYVELGMYPFASVTWAWDELWAAIHRRVPWTPESLTWTGDCEAAWHDHACVVSHICGWPFMAHHHDELQLVGSFDLELSDAEPGGRYRAILLSSHDRPLANLIDPATRVVANSDGSLSGWLSLHAATVGVGEHWPGPVTFTSSHLESVRALARGDGDLASIDSWSLAFIADESPELLDGLHRVGTGPLVPTPAITARHSVDERQLAALRSAFHDALADPALERALTALHIRGSAPLVLDDYRALLPRFNRA